MDFVAIGEIAAAARRYEPRTPVAAGQARHGLHAANPNHESIIVCSSEDLDFIGPADRIHAAIEALPKLSGQFIRIVRPQR